MKNKNKCRICGYRFKSDDEIICPECFTARDDDVSCSNYSDDLHSHDLRDNNYFGSPENDTFKEEKNDFVTEERKDEAEDKNFRSPYSGQSAANTYNSPFSQNSTGSYNSTREQKLATIRSGYANYQNTFNSAGANGGINTPFNTQRPKPQGKGCAVAIFIIIAAFFIVPIAITLIAAVSTSHDNDYHDYDYSYDENIYNDDDMFDDGNSAQHLFTPQYSDDDSYSVTYTGMTVSKKKVSQLTEDQRKSITSGVINGDDILEVTVSLDTEIEDSETQVKFSYAFSIAYDKDSNNILNSESISPDSNDDYSDDTTYDVKFYVPVDTDRVSLYVYLEDDDWESSSFVFDIPLNNDGADSDDLSDISGTEAAA